MKNRGKVFESELMKSMGRCGMLAERIPDALFWNGKRIMSKETPADFHAFVASEELICLMIEAKATSQKSIPFERLQPHQEEALGNFESFHRLSKSYVAVNFYDQNSIRTMNVMFMVPYPVWEEYKGGTRKSLSMLSCVEDPRIVECPRMKGSMYDMGDFLVDLNKDVK